MYLVIAEKPSVSRAIARVIRAENREEGFLSGKDCIVSWCLGHLAEYLPPDGYDKRYESWKYEDLPIIPDEWKLAVSQEKKEQFYTLKRLLNSPDVEYVVNACDAGREGELIFRRVYQLSGSRKPVKRLWVSSMEDSACGRIPESGGGGCLPCKSGLAGRNERNQGFYNQVLQETYSRKGSDPDTCHAGRPDGTDQKVPEGEVFQRGTGL